MVGVYILILCLSAGLAGFAGVRVWARLSPMLNKNSNQLGACAVVPGIAFLIVAMAPPSVLFFASLLLAAHYFLRTLKRGHSLVLLATAVLLPMVFFHLPLAPGMSAIPYPLALLVTSFGWLAFTLGLSRVPAALTRHALMQILACLPIAFAPLYLKHSSAISIDAAILASGWFGVLMPGKIWQVTGYAAQLVSNYLLGYLILFTVWQGAWPLAVLSAAIAIGGALFARTPSIDPTPEMLARA